MASSFVVLSESAGRRNRNHNDCNFLSEREIRSLDEGNAPHHHYARIRRKNYYDLGICQKIQVLYIVAVVIWIILVWWLDLYKTDGIGWFFILLPIFIYAINYSYVHKAEIETENDMFAGNFLSFGFLIAAFIISWTNAGVNPKVFKIIFVGIVLIMFSLIDVWLPKQEMVISKHLRTIFQTGALSLLALALYIYYQETIITGKCSGNSN